MIDPASIIGTEMLSEDGVIDLLADDMRIPYARKDRNGVIYVTLVPRELDLKLRAKRMENGQA